MKETRGTPDEPVAVHDADAGLPSLRAYASDVWDRRELVGALASSDLKAEHFATVFGQAWNVLNPILLAGVFLVLLHVVTGGERSDERTAVLVAGVFYFQFTRNSLSTAANSILRGQRLVLNAVFPRAALPLAAVLSSVLLFLPTLVVYVGVHAWIGLPLTPSLLLWLVLLFVPLVVFSTGVALFYAAATVEFRDANAFLPHILRYWFYLTPVLYFVRDIPSDIKPLLTLNPLYPVFAGLQRTVLGGAPTPTQLVAATAWAIVAFLAGSFYFVARESHFAVRL